MMLLTCCHDLLKNPASSCKIFARSCHDLAMIFQKILKDLATISILLRSCHDLLKNSVSSCKIFAEYCHVLAKILQDRSCHDYYIYSQTTLIPIRKRIIILIHIQQIHESYTENKHSHKIVQVYKTI